jgi:hypothetical protein
MKGKFDFEEYDRSQLNFTKTFILSKNVAIRGQEVNVDFLQDLQEADNCISIDSVKQLDTGYEKSKESLSQPEGIDSIGTERSNELLDALFPIRNEEKITDYSHVINTPQNRENLLCIEFPVDQNLEEADFLSNLDQSMVDSHMQFKLNGRIHTKNIFWRDLDFALNGKKIVKSIQSRLDNYANYLLKVKKGMHSLKPEKLQEAKACLKLIKKNFFIKFINISQSFGIKVEIDPKNFSSRKPVNVYTANFNKIVKIGMRIKSFIFVVNIPTKDLVLTRSLVPDYDTVSHESIYSSQGTSSLDLNHWSSVNSCMEPKPEPRLKGKKLSTKSRSYVGHSAIKSSNTEPLQNVDMNKQIITRTPFENFLLASTPFVTQLDMNDTLMLMNLNADFGIELFYTSEGEKICDIYLPTLKGLSCAYHLNSISPNIETFNYTEEEPLYNRAPFEDKLEELNEKEDTKLFQVPLPNIMSSSWISIEWFLHYSSGKLKHGAQRSIIVYYSLDFTKPNWYLPIMNWEINDCSSILPEIYKIPNFHFFNGQTYDLNSYL